VFPDPVHPYLLAADDVARRVVPSPLPVCNSDDVATCVRDNYRAPLERLYRRPLSEAELSALTDMVPRLEQSAVPALEATRALLSAALLSPDFLFRSSLAGADDVADARRLVETLSYALWDAPPDVELAAAAEGSAEALGERLRAQAARLSGDSRAVPVLTRFVAQWLHVDTDLRLVDPAYATSPRFQEFVAFVEDGLANDVPVRTLLTSERGFVHSDNVAAYGLADLPGTAGSGVSAVSWPSDSPRRGVLGQDLIADSTRHPDDSRRAIFRGLLVRRSLLCDVIPAPTAALVALAGEVGDRTVDARCAACHQRIDPIGRAFAVLDADSVAAPAPPEVIHHPELAGSYPDIPALLTAVAGSRAFAECFARHWLAFFLEAPLAEADATWVAALADSIESGVSLRGLVEQSIVSLKTRSETATPWCEGS